MGYHIYISTFSSKISFYYYNKTLLWILCATLQLDNEATKTNLQEKNHL